jgi:hypothetical protein
MMSDVIFIRITDAFVSLISGPLKLSQLHLQLDFTYLTRRFLLQSVLRLPIRMTIPHFPQFQSLCPYYYLTESWPYSSLVVYLIHFPENETGFLNSWYWG